MAQSTVKKGWFNVLNISKHDELAGPSGPKIISIGTLEF